MKSMCNTCILHNRLHNGTKSESWKYYSSKTLLNETSDTDKSQHFSKMQMGHPILAVVSYNKLSFIYRLHMTCNQSHLLNVRVKWLACPLCIQEVISLNLCLNWRLSCFIRFEILPAVISGRTFCLHLQGNRFI
jgi:hypothetical protein